MVFDVTVCGMSSWLIQVTVSPAFTVICCAIEGEVVDLHFDVRRLNRARGHAGNKQGHRAHARESSRMS